MSAPEKPRPVNPANLGASILSTPEQSSFGFLATVAATSALEKPWPARKAMTVSGLAGDLRWESCVEALMA
jgi:hypothetical protein